MTPQMPEGPALAQTLRQRYINEWSQLDTIYTTWRGTHQDIFDYMQPGRGRFVDFDQNRGTRQDQQIVNDTAVDAQRKLAAAMHTGITSEASEWFRYGTDDPEQAEDDELHDYLESAQRGTFALLAGSNFYKIIPQLYMDLVGPGVGLLFIEQDDEDGIRFVHVPVGQYRLATDARGRVCKVMRRFGMTVAQMVAQFGEEACSPGVREAFKNNRKEDRWQILHVVEKRQNLVYGKRDKKNKPWASCWMEWGGVSATGPAAGVAVNTSDSTLGLLRESGYDRCPFVAPRWDVVGEDAYGKGSPGWQTLGDARAIQALEKTNAKNVARLGDPPLNVPADLANASLLPSAVNYLPANAKGKIEPAVVIPPAAITVGEEKVERHEKRIQRGNFSELLFMISSEQRHEQTATEVNAKQNERLLQLGGTFARFADEALRPLINGVLFIGQQIGRIPLPPLAVLRRLGSVKVQFENILVAAQRTIKISAFDRLVASAGNLATIGRKDAVEELKPHEILRAEADMLGVSRKMLISDAERAALQAEQHKQAQAQAQGAAMTQGASALKQLSETDPEKLQQLLQQFGPAAAAAASGRPA